VSVPPASRLPAATPRAVRVATYVAVRVAPLLALAACGDAGVQSILHPAGEGAARIARLWWTLLAAGSVVYLVVLGLGAWALLRRRRGETEPRGDRIGLWLGTGGVAIPVTILAGVLALTLITLARDAAAERRHDDLRIKVIGKQWWWEIEYQDSVPSRRLHMANELHIPVGREVMLELESRDVIHSFWVPALQGKRDMVPGRKHKLRLRADRPGVFRGQCAEFCGHQHTNMAFVVVAHTPADYAAWYERALRPAPAPVTALEQEGQRVFLEKPCAMCHTVRGTVAMARAGPDLTHLASRRTLAAGALRMSRGNLGGWVSDPQGIKPGSHMPNVDLDGRELRALLAYLETLR
jgi:cytochrome c oxidase subunit 2